MANCAATEWRDEAQAPRVSLTRTGNWVLRVLVAVAILVSLLVLPSAAQFSTDWRASMGVTSDDSSGAMVFGAKPGYYDGYDGQGVVNTTNQSGALLLMYRQNSPQWTGPTGFYGTDYQSPIPKGGSKTWSDIYLWNQNYSLVLGDRAEVAVGPDYPFVPSGYLGQLVLDYVPGSLNWTGSMEYWIDMRQGRRIILPVPTVTDPLQGVRMHLTVYAPPVPEPSSLVGLAAGLSALAGVRLRRRKQGP